MESPNRTRINVEMASLVSIVIPCFNAGRWISEAIDSCLSQTYTNIEVVVIDDGSTDTSLEIIRNYEGLVKWVSTVNRGGGATRNAGFELSTGEFIQFLDADDYLLPEKIARQVAFLKKTNADVVYGDWRHQYHTANGEVYLGEVIVSGAQSDILESLLRNWWVSPACILFKRAIVEISGGWDEFLDAGQDRDFFLSIAMPGAHVVYQSGCYSVYRRYGNVTVSTSCKRQFLEGHQALLEKARRKLAIKGGLTQKYKHAICESYLSMARQYLAVDLSVYLKLLERILPLCPGFRASYKCSLPYRFLQSIVGFSRTEWMLRKLWGFRRLLTPHKGRE